MKEGDVVLTPVPQADGSVKTRPAILLREFPPYRDFLVCGVSTQFHQEVKGFDETVSSSDPDFAATNIPSNIHGLVYIPFPKGLVSAAFGVLGRELRTAFAKTQ
jgi:hypothetical protein